MPLFKQAIKATRRHKENLVYQHEVRSNNCKKTENDIQTVTEIIQHHPTVGRKHPIEAWIALRELLKNELEEKNTVRQEAFDKLNKENIDTSRSQYNSVKSNAYNQGTLSPLFKKQTKIAYSRNQDDSIQIKLVL